MPEILFRVSLSLVHNSGATTGPKLIDNSKCFGWPSGAGVLVIKLISNLHNKLSKTLTTCRMELPNVKSECEVWRGGCWRGALVGLITNFPCTAMCYYVYALWATPLGRPGHAFNCFKTGHSPPVQRLNSQSLWPYSARSDRIFANVYARNLFSAC